MSKSGLGKGLGAIFSQVDTASFSEEENIINLHTSDIKPNPYQPRKLFNEEELEALADSIKEHGLIQPVVVTKEKDFYQLVVGERRWRAALKAGQKTIPAVLRKKEDTSLLEVALVENIQRSDLNPLEEAAAYEQLSEEFGMTQEEIAERVGKNRSTVANILRLLNLPEEIKESLKKGLISAGHARAILMFETIDLQLKAYKKIMDYGLSVRQSEELAREKNFREKEEKKKETIIKKPEIIDIEDNLGKMFGTEVKINKKGKNFTRGKIEISYYSIEDLNRLIEILQSKSYIKKTSIEDIL